MVGIYAIKNKINNKIYIGRSTDIQRRWTTHLLDGRTKKIKTRIIPKLKVQRLSAEMPLGASVWLRNGRLSFVR